MLFYAALLYLLGFRQLVRMELAHTTPMLKTTHFDLYNSEQPSEHVQHAQLAEHNFDVTQALAEICIALVELSVCGHNVSVVHYFQARGYEDGKLKMSMLMNLPAATIARPSEVVHCEKFLHQWHL